MRLRLSLRSKKPFSVSLNYQQYLSAVIYDLIAQASPDHAGWLHDKGFSFGKKNFKHFTFSRLLFPERPFIKDDRLYIDGPFDWLISVHAETTLLQFIVGLFERRTFHLVHPAHEVVIRGVEMLPEPVFRQTMNFICLSPVLVKKPVMKHVNGKEKMTAEHLMPDHPEAGHYLNQNLKNKYLSLYPELPDNEKTVVFTPDEDYIKRRGGKVSKLISFKSGSDMETHHRAFECPFTLEGDTELIKIAYECGLGENNAVGFGMIEISGNRGQHEK